MSEKLEKITIPSLIEKSIEKNNDKRLFAMGIIRSQWDEIMGKYARTTYLANLADRKGVILAESSTLIHQLHLMRGEIISKINEVLEKNYLLDLNFRIGSIPVVFQEENYIEDMDLDKIFLSPEEIMGTHQEFMEIEEGEFRNSLIVMKINHLKKNKFLLEHGGKRCLSCGIVYFGREKRCYSCEREHLDSKKNELMVLFDTLESVNKNSVISLLDISGELYEEVKRKKLRQLLNEAVSNFMDKDVDTTKKIVEKYLLLETDDSKNLRNRANDFIEYVVKEEIRKRFEKNSFTRKL